MTDLDMGMDEALEADGISPMMPAPVDYFSAGDEYTFSLPDGVQTITCKTFNEADRRAYQSAGNKEVRIHRATRDAYFKMATPEERRALLERAIVGWTLTTTDKSGVTVPMAFTPQNRTRFLDVAPPSIIDFIEKEVRNHEKWLMDDMTTEDIDKQIEELQELRVEVAKREEGKAS